MVLGPSVFQVLLTFFYFRSTTSHIVVVYIDGKKLRALGNLIEAFPACGWFKTTLNDSLSPVLFLVQASQMMTVKLETQLVDRISAFFVPCPWKVDPGLFPGEFSSSVSSENV